MFLHSAPTKISLNNCDTTCGTLETPEALACALNVLHIQQRYSTLKEWRLQSAVQQSAGSGDMTTSRKLQSSKSCPCCTYLRGNGLAQLGQIPLVTQLAAILLCIACMLG